MLRSLSKNVFFITTDDDYVLYFSDFLQETRVKDCFVA